MLPRTRETPTQGETSRDRISVARQQNESEQQVGLVSFTTDVNSLIVLEARTPNSGCQQGRTPYRGSQGESVPLFPSLRLFGLKPHHSHLCL